ncbi:hypothetical protein CRUP_014348 [Coryphaenoides rupestris]|nr:hypothetical protein CRUP_014348 [Coryphaenoides rupestris]
MSFSSGRPSQRTTTG